MPKPYSRAVVLTALFSVTGAGAWADANQTEYGIYVPYQQTRREIRYDCWDITNNSPTKVEVYVPLNFREEWDGSNGIKTLPPDGVTFNACPPERLSPLPGGNLPPERPSLLPEGNLPSAYGPTANSPYQGNSGDGGTAPSAGGSGYSPPVVDSGNIYNPQSDDGYNVGSNDNANGGGGGGNPQGGYNSAGQPSVGGGFDARGVNVGQMGAASVGMASVEGATSPTGSAGDPSADGGTAEGGSAEGGGSEGGEGGGGEGGEGGGGEGGGGGGRS